MPHRRYVLWESRQNSAENWTASATFVHPTGAVHVRPEPLYYWFYFIIVNGIWIVVPSMCILHAAGKVSRAVAKEKKA